MRKKLFTILTGAMLAIGIALVPTAAQAAGTSYAGCDTSVPLFDKWPMTSAPGTQVAYDILRPANNAPLVSGWGQSPYITFTGSAAKASNSGVFVSHSNINLGTGDWTMGASIQTRDGLYNWWQFGLSHGGGASPEGFVKFTAAYIYIQGSLGEARINSTRNFSDGLKHRVCAQLIDGHFKYVIDGVTQGEKDVTVGSINLNGTDTPMQMMCKYWPSHIWDISDCLDSTNAPTYTWDYELGFRSNG